MVSVPVVVVTIVTGYLIWKLLWFVVTYRKWDHIHNSTTPLGTRHPIYGTMHHYSDAESFLKHAMSRLEQTRAKMMSGWLFFLFPTFVVCHPDTAKLLLRSSEPKARRFSMVYRSFLPWLGDGLLVSDGPKWERNRKLLTPAFHFDILQPYVNTYNKVTDILLDKLWSESKSGQFVEVAGPVGLATLDTMLRCAFSYEGGVQVRGRPWLFPDLVFYLTKEGRQFRSLTQYVHEFSSDIIKARRKSIETDPSQLKKRRLDFLDILLAARDETGTGMSDEDIRAEVDTFLFEGHDTTASAISWAIYALAKYPKEQEHLAAEVEEVIGTRTCVEWEDLSKLRYQSLFIKEVMRMYSPVPFVARCLTRPLVYGSTVIPPGFGVDILLVGIHHHPDVYPDHDTFRPERFADNVEEERDPYAFVPFSAGPRNCIGQNFALNEIKVVLTRLLRRFRVELDEDHKIVFLPDLVMRAKYGIKVKLCPR
ncbi:leukotriene-B4 omega-hydroxylase 3-like isoform X2 [Mizuhopecten yessoensis]|uniref:leukotriene-B4 omega-hydroxylase 3-like isoform X2 n=1 Tax=Mizuhopecten yessoensis TaxID=6573 RepID=UPI000B45AA15|nr:leukotriene-B4 omega-hydroxylase 3-like isoform X2 [Mizuhopecten yessoensis]